MQSNNNRDLLLNNSSSSSNISSSSMKSTITTITSTMSIAIMQVLVLQHLPQCSNAEDRLPLTLSVDDPAALPMQVAQQ
jgi:hypothetical protein